MRNRRGFTLIEVLLTLTLVVVVAALMYSFFGQGLTLYTVETQSAEEQTNLRQVLSDITNRVRLADPAEIAVTEGSLAVGDMVYTYDSSGKRILRNGTALADGISVFAVAQTGTLIEISVTSIGGTVVSTSLSLAQ